MVKGTFSSRAIVRAMSVLPVPVGPTSTTFDLSISISPSASADFERMRL